MERKFSKKEKQILEMVCSLGKQIKVKGVNSYGKEFEVVGRITNGDRGDPAVYDEAIVLEFGNEKDAPHRKQTKWFGYYNLNDSKSSLSINLIITEIEDLEGNILYTAKDAKEIYNQTKARGEERLKANEERKIIYPDPVTKELQNLVGHPISIITEGEEETFILLDASLVNNFGTTMVEVTSGPLQGCVSLDKDSILLEIDKDDKKVYVANNTEKEYEKARQINKPKLEKQY